MHHWMNMAMMTMMTVIRIDVADAVTMVVVTDDDDDNNDEYDDDDDYY